MAQQGRIEDPIEYAAVEWAQYADMAGIPDETGPDGMWFIEPILVLTVRDELPPEALAFTEAIEADRRIFAQREKLLPYFQWVYKYSRAKENPPKSSWWWWLDEIVAGTYTEPLPDYLSK